VSPIIHTSKYPIAWPSAWLCAPSKPLLLVGLRTAKRFNIHCNVADLAQQRPVDFGKDIDTVTGGAGVKDGGSGESAHSRSIRIVSDTDFVIGCFTFLHLFRESSYIVGHRLHRVSASLRSSHSDVVNDEH
jgi:hypothetical protein